MRRTVLHVVLPILALVSACGGTTPTAPGATLTIVGASAVFAMGSSQQLRAIPGGSAANCASVQWTSSAPAILSVGPDGVATAQSPGEADISATCGGATAAIHARVSRVSAVRIGRSLVTPVRVGGSERLAASALSGTQLSACSSWEWESSRTNVATVTVTPSAYVAILTAHAPGETTITATCDGVSGSITVPVTAGWSVSVLMNEIPPVSMFIDGTVEVLTGPHAGTRVEGSIGRIARLLDMDFPFRVRLSADEYQDAEFDVTADNVELYPQYSSAEIRLQMKPLPAPAGTDEYIVQLGAKESGSWRFELRGSGTFSALVRLWHLDYDEWLDLELRCDDRLLASGRRGGGRSAALTTSVPGPCAGEVKVRPQIRYPSVALRLRVTYPH